MNKPTVGRQVHFFANGDLNQFFGQKLPLAATIAFVHSDNLVNLQVLDGNGQARAMTSVQLLNDGAKADDAPPIGSGYYAAWPGFEQREQNDDVLKAIDAVQNPEHAGAKISNAYGDVAVAHTAVGTGLGHDNDVGITTQDKGNSATVIPERGLGETEEDYLARVNRDSQPTSERREDETQEAWLARVNRDTAQVETRDPVSGLPVPPNHAQSIHNPMNQANPQPTSGLGGGIVTGEGVNGTTIEQGAVDPAAGVPTAESIERVNASDEKATNDQPFGEAELDAIDPAHEVISEHTAGDERKAD